MTWIITPVCIFILGLLFASKTRDPYNKTNLHISVGVVVLTLLIAHWVQ